MRYSSRFFLYAPFAGLILLTVIAVTHWWVVAGALARKLDAVNGHEIMPGVHVSFTQKRLAGFPFRVDVTLKNLRVTVEDVSGPFTWSSEDFAAHALTYGREQWIFEAAGRQTLSWSDAKGAPHRFAFLPGTFRASAIWHNGQLSRFDAAIADLDGAEFRAANAQLHFRSLPEAIDIYLRLDAAHLGSGYAASLGPDVTTLVADTSIVRPALFAKMLRGEEAPDSVVETWRNNGGALTVRALTLARGGHTSHFRGALTLDNAHDLQGALAAPDRSELRLQGKHVSLVTQQRAP